MDVRYYVDALIRHLDSKRSRKYIEKTSDRLTGKRSGVLKSWNFNTMLVCMRTVDEVYEGLIEKYTVQSDVSRAQEISSVYNQLRAIDFEEFMKTGDCKPNLLYFLHKLSAGSASFVAPHEVAGNSSPATEVGGDDGLCNETVCLVDWGKILTAGDLFEIRKFEGEDSCFEDEARPSTVMCSDLLETSPTSSPSSKEEAVESQSLSQSDRLLQLGPKPDLPSCGETEFSICNRCICVLSGANCDDPVLPLPLSGVILDHLSRGSLETSVFQMMGAATKSLKSICSLHASSGPPFSAQADHLAQLGMACGVFIEFITAFVNGLSRRLKPATLLHFNYETSDIRRLVVIFGSAVSAVDAEAKLQSAREKTHKLIEFALAVQTKLHAAIVGRDTSAASWLLLLWLSALRSLLRAAIHSTFSAAANCDWFDVSLFDSNIKIGELKLQQVNNLLKATYRYLMMLRQCREEVGDFLTQARLFALPTLFETFLDELFEREDTPSQFTSPLVKANGVFPVDLLDQMSQRWMAALTSECRSASAELYAIWRNAGLHSWLIAVRLVFLCQSVAQFDGRAKFVKASSPALDLLSLHMPQGVWLEFVPYHIRSEMLIGHSSSEVSASLDSDYLTEQYKNCKTVANALEFMESSSANCQPLILFPISLFLGQEVLAKYVRVHSFLSAFHVSKNWLSRSLLNIDPQSSCYGKFAAVRLAPRSQRSVVHLTVTPADRLLWLLRSAIFFALSALQQYFFTSVVCANCHRLEQELQDVATADDLERIHNDVVNQIVAGCLFPVGHRTYQASLRHLIVLSDMLSRQQIAPKKQVHELYSRSNFTSFSNFSVGSDDFRANANATHVGESETSWKLLATDTYQGIRFLADTLSRSASKSHSVTRSSLSSSLFDSDFSSSSVAWLATELQHASNIVSKQSKILLQLMHSK